MHRLKRAFDPATFGTLKKAQLGQRLHIVMNAPDIARHPACQLPHRQGSLALQCMHQSPATLCELAEKLPAVSKFSTSPW